jgi:hypothetical protein
MAFLRLICRAGKACPAPAKIACILRLAGRKTDTQILAAFLTGKQYEIFKCRMRWAHGGGYRKQLYFINIL